MSDKNTYQIGSYVEIIGLRAPGIVRAYTVHPCGVTYQIEYWSIDQQCMEYHGDHNTLKKITEKEFKRLTDERQLEEKSILSDD